MKYLLDTCVLSELIKRQPNTDVVYWIKKQEENSLYISALTLGEIEKGIQKTPDGSRKAFLKLWLENDLINRFQGRIISIDAQVSTRWGQVQGVAELKGKPMPAIDGLIAVSALVHSCIVVTRNTSDMLESQAELFDPWVNKI